jgi:hypothetical protein
MGASITHHYDADTHSPALITARLLTRRTGQGGDGAVEAELGEAFGVTRPGAETGTPKQPGGLLLGEGAPVGRGR